MNKTISAVCIAVLALLAMPAGVAHATDPSVTSFTPNSYNATYAFGVLFTWTIADGSGASLLFTCPTGVTVKTADGTAFPCGTTQTVSSASGETQYYSFVNLTGAAKNVTVKLIPKDFAGVEFPNNGSTLTINVDPVAQPITDFTISTKNVQSGTAFSVTWTGIAIAGANLQLDCVPELTYYGGTSTSSPTLPCNAPAFTNDLAGSGTQTILAINSSGSTIGSTVRVLPAMTTGVYDGVHGLSQSFSVSPKAAAALPSVSQFSVAHIGGPYDEAFTFQWTAQNTSGVVFQLQCITAVVATTFKNSATSTVPCNQAAYALPFPASGSQTIWFKADIAQPVVVTILPQSADSTYDGTRGKSVTVSVMPPNMLAAGQTAQTTVATTQTTPATGSGTSVGKKVVHTLTFTTYLARGSRGAQVTALQQLLAQDSQLYPSGLVTGFFGPGTETAVGAFQVRYGIAKKGEAGYGTLGPKTRTKLNSLQTF